jgi:hypothetical protein
MNMSLVTLPPFSATTPCVPDRADLRPAIDALEKAIRAEQPTPEKPLFVVMGESHVVPAHKMLQQGLIKRLLSGTSPLALAYGMETDHNLLARYISRVSGRPMQQCLDVKDPDGQKLLRSLLADQSFYYYSCVSNAPVSERNLLRFLVEQNVSVRANDTATKLISEKRVLDRDDPVTAALIERYAPLIAGEIPVKDIEGVSKRNYKLEQGAQDHAHETGAAVYLQHCGRDHVLGCSNSKYPYAGSLTARFVEAGQNVLPVFIRYRSEDKDGMKMLPPGAEAVLRERGLEISGLDDLKEFHLGTPGEMREVQHIAARSGDAIDIYPEQSWLERWRERRALKREMETWVAQAQKAPAAQPD